MKKHILSLSFAFLSICGGSAVTVEVGSVRQDWPWSGQIHVDYSISGVTQATVVEVALYDGERRLDESGAKVAFDAPVIVSDGNHSLSIDLSGLPGVGIEIPSLRVGLTPVAADPTWSFPLYLDVDLESGEVEPITPAEIITGAVGSWKWADASAATISQDNEVAYTNLVWTGVAEGDAYKTTHLVMRYLAAKGDKVMLLNRSDSTYDMPEDFYIAVFETTQEQWKRIYGEAAANYSSGNTKPVVNIAYDDVRGADVSTFFPRDPAAESFVGKLRKLVDGTVAFDLPMGYQWQYADMAKSGFGKLKTWNDNSELKDSSAAGTIDDNLPGRYKGNGGTTAPVGTYAPSAQGLYDMHGNVNEMCVDWYKSGETQGNQKLWANNPNINLEDPEYDRIAKEKMTTRFIVGGYYSDHAYRMALNYARNFQDVSTGASSTGFRVICPVAEDSTTPAEFGEAVDDVSEPVAVIAKPKETWFWRTAPGATFTVSWTLPAGATKATLTVAGHNYMREYADLTATSQELTLPTAEENVYTLTLAFDKGEPKTAKLGWVKSEASGATATAAYVPEGTRKWHRAAAWNVLPIPFGATALTVDGEPVETGLDGAAGWYGLDFAGADAKTVKLTVDDVDYENALMLPSGILLIVR